MSNEAYLLLAIVALCEVIRTVMSLKKHYKNKKKGDNL